MRPKVIGEAAEFLSGFRNEARREFDFRNPDERFNLTFESGNFLERKANFGLATFRPYEIAIESGGGEVCGKKRNLL